MSLNRNKIYGFYNEKVLQHSHYHKVITYFQYEIIVSAFLSFAVQIQLLL